MDKKYCSDCAHKDEIIFELRKWKEKYMRLLAHLVEIGKFFNDYKN